MSPLCRPVAVAAGENLTLRVHEAPAARDALQPLSANSALVLDSVIGIVAVVLFLRVKVSAALVVPWVTEPNERDEGAIVIGVTPVPVKVAV